MCDLFAGPPAKMLCTTFSSAPADIIVRLRVPVSSTNQLPVVPSSGSTIAEGLAHGKRRAVEARYRNCSFVLGSAVIVERLWTVGKYIYSDNRKSISPVLFESILFLRTNDPFWDLDLVSEAMRMPESERVASMSVEDSEQASEASE